MLEVAARRIRRPATHTVEIPVSRKENTCRPNKSTGQVCAGRPETVALSASSRTTRTVTEVLGVGGIVFLHPGRRARIAIGKCPVDHVEAHLPLIQSQLVVGT